MFMDKAVVVFWIRPRGAGDSVPYYLLTLLIPRTPDHQRPYSFTMVSREPSCYMRIIPMSTKDCYFKH